MACKSLKFCLNPLRVKECNIKYLGTMSTIFSGGHKLWLVHYLLPKLTNYDLLLSSVRNMKTIYLRVLGNRIHSQCINCQLNHLVLKIMKDDRRNS